MLRYAVRSDVGSSRETNEDATYAGSRLLAVADGMGGHTHGEVASATAVAALAPLDDNVSTSDLLDGLERATQMANERLRHMADTNPAMQGMGTTLTAIRWDGDRLAAVHVGDTRAYLLRDGDLEQLTRDHTLVQALIDDGHISPDEAATHPHRALLLHALDGHQQLNPDLFVREAHVGDRYLLCSDGLSDALSPDTLRATLQKEESPDRVAEQLVRLANSSGSRDNITGIVADLVDTTDQGRRVN